MYGTAQILILDRTGVSVHAAKSVAELPLALKENKLNSVAEISFHFPMCALTWRFIGFVS